jgi:protein-S-isoprenylcysteine O-methyltransferase Ste14
MPDAIRHSLLATGLVFLAVAFSYRIRSLSRESLDRKKEGWPILIGLRVAALLTAAATAALLNKPAVMGWALFPVPAGLRWVGVACFVCSAAWLLWMFQTLGRNLTDTVVTRQNATFVERGPYRFVRNPMYTGVLMIGMSLGLAIGTWLVPLGAGLIFTILALRTKTEEKFLVLRFGDVYTDYMGRVGRFFPRLSAR